MIDGIVKGRKNGCISTQEKDERKCSENEEKKGDEPRRLGAVLHVCRSAEVKEK